MGGAAFGGLLASALAGVRDRAEDAKGGLGGLQAVDDVLRSIPARLTGPARVRFFEEYVKAFDPPTSYFSADWGAPPLVQLVHFVREHLDHVTDAAVWAVLQRELGGKQPSPTKDGKGDHRRLQPDEGDIVAEALPRALRTVRSSLACADAGCKVITVKQKIIFTDTEGNTNSLWMDVCDEEEQQKVREKAKGDEDTFLSFLDDLNIKPWAPELRAAG
eukprot:gene27149-14040_t